MGVREPSSASNAEEHHVVPPTQESLNNDGEGDRQAGPLMDCADLGSEVKA